MQCFYFRDAHEQQGHPTKQDVRANALGRAVKHGAKVQLGLERAKRILDIGELFVAQGNVLRGEHWGLWCCRTRVKGEAPNDTKRKDIW